MSYSLLRCWNIFEGFQNNMGNKHLISYPEYIEYIKKIFNCNAEEAHFVIPLIAKELETMKVENINTDDEIETYYNNYKKYLNGLTPLHNGHSHNPPYSAMILQYNRDNVFPNELHKTIRAVGKHMVTAAQRLKLQTECVAMQEELKTFIEEQNAELTKAQEGGDKEKMALLGFTINQLRKVEIILLNYDKLSLEWAVREGMLAIGSFIGRDKETQTKYRTILEKIIQKAGQYADAAVIAAITVGIDKYLLK